MADVENPLERATSMVDDDSGSAVGTADGVLGLEL